MTASPQQGASSLPATADSPASTDVGQIVEQFVDDSWDPDIPVREWWARMATAGLASPTLPVDAGGRGWTAGQATQASRVLADRRVVGPPSGLGMLLAAPTIAKHANREQIDQWMPSILNGTEGWCQLFSEPGAGSDLAGLQAKAVKDGDEWIITGQKVWTSNGHECEWGMLIARTDPDLPKHQGITYFGFPMNQPGVEVRPLTEMTGRALFNEVFISEARVSDSNIIGGRGNGWRVANSTLAFERMGISGGHGGGFGTATPGAIAGHLDRPVGDFLGYRPPISVGAVGRRVLRVLQEEADKRDKSSDPVVREALVQLHVLHRLASLSSRRFSAERKAARQSGVERIGLGVGVEGNVAKVHNSRVLMQARHVAGLILGPDAALVGDDSATGGMLQELILFSPAPPIYGGTDEIQRNVIGERGLGLPKEPGPSKDTPFSRL